jgi:DHA1 family inner membrane transport protein
MGLVPFYATDVFDGSTGLAGVLASAQGVGAILGGVVVTALIARFRRSAVLVGVVIAVTVMLTLFALAPTRLTAMITIFILGGCATAMFLSLTAFVQRDAPASRRGRVLSLQQGAGGTTYGLGLVTIGGLADLTSIRVAFVVGAWVMLLGFIVVNVRTGHWREAADGEMPPPTEEALNAEPVRVGWRRLLFGAGQPVADDSLGR